MRPSVGFTEMEFLHLTLVLPDGMRSYIPADLYWQNYHILNKSLPIHIDIMLLLKCPKGDREHSMEIPNTEAWRFTDVRFLPIFKEYAKRINLVETIDAMVNTQRELYIGETVLAMIIDTLSGRTPLYRLEESFNGMDTELFHGKGRPKTGEVRKLQRREYDLKITIEDDPEKIEKLRLDAGCFVLIANVPIQDKEQNWSGAELLRRYKEQDGIEKISDFLRIPLSLTLYS